MPQSSLPHNSTDSGKKRIPTLRTHEVFPATVQASMQNFVQLIAADFDVPMAAVGMIDKDEIVIKASVGLEGISRLERSDSFFSLAMQPEGIVVFSDARQEPAFRDNRFVHQQPGIRFYAGLPLTVDGGATIGLLFIAHREQRTLVALEHRRLARFANYILYELDLMATLQAWNEKIRQKEVQLKQAFHKAEIGTWEYDPVTKTATWSDELFELFGIDPSQLKGSTVEAYLSLFRPEDLPSIYEKLQNPEQVPDETKEHLVRPDGKEIVVSQLKKNFYDEDGRLVKIIGITQDITRRFADEKKIKESEERFRALVQNSSDLIAVLDVNAHFKYVSPAVESISGYDPGELIGRNVFDFIHKDDTTILHYELAEVAKSTNSGEPTLHRFLTKSGSWIWLESKGMNRMNNSQIGGIIINARDVTERILLEERFDREQQNYQRAITAAVIKAQEIERSQLGRELHDNVNQVLTTVKLYMELLNSGIGDQKEILEKSQRHLQSCIDEIRSISKRLSAPTLGEISLEDSVRELIESINLTNRIEIFFNTQNIAGLHITPEMHLAIYRIIQEQLNNIIKYAEASLVFISLTRKESKLYLQVTDNGKGFDINVRRAGIGITNMRTRAENLSGQFEVISSEGKGCQLRVQLPLSEPPVG